MRITKAWLRQYRGKLEDRIKQVFNMTDIEAQNELKSMFPNAILGTREENIKTILLLSVDLYIPGSFLS